MRIRCISAISASLLAVATASDPRILPLQWVKKQAYVVDASIDGQPVQLQLGTLTSDVWLACSRFGSGTCTPGKCDAGITVEHANLCVTTVAGSTLSLGSSSDSLTFADVSIKVAQYHPMNDTTSAPAVYSSNGQVYSTADSSSKQPPLVSKTIQGVLGLGPNSQPWGNTTSSTSSRATTKASVYGKIDTFGLYLVKENDGIGSFLQVGGSRTDGFDTGLILGRGITVAYSPPVQRIASYVNYLVSWDLSLVAVQFDQETPFYPRKYSSTEKPGGDATAMLSLNHALLMMPPDVKMLFEKAHLTSCEKDEAAAVGQYHSCELSILETLPRISLYISDKVFYLDPADYTHVSSSNDSVRIVEIGDSGQDRTWYLGAPFLRKFPSFFTVSPPIVDLFCTADVSCRSQGGTFARVHVAPVSNSTSDGSSSNGDSKGSSVVLLVVGLGGVALVAALVAAIFKRRGTTTTPPSRDTVASEPDLEEAKRDQQ